MLALSTFRRSFFIAAAIIVSGCAGQLETTNDLALTWQRAYFAFPDQTKPRHLSNKALDRIARTGAKYPAILYLHGCTGFGKREKRLAGELAKAGFVFVAPDSMARTYRPLQCNPKSRTGGHNLFVYDFRKEELRFALGQLLQHSWVEKENLFLMGGSEGAVAAALYGGEEFRARVLFQWTCQGAPLVRGLAAPLNEPILAIVNRGDPWYDEVHTVGQSGHCGSFFGPRAKSESIVLDRPGIHDVLELDKIRYKIQMFMLDLLQSTSVP